MYLFSVLPKYTFALLTPSTHDKNKTRSGSTKRQAYSVIGVGPWAPLVHYSRSITDTGRGYFANGRLTHYDRQVLQFF